MWQPLIAGLIVAAAAVYAVRALGPRRWRRKQCGAGGTDVGTGAAKAADARDSSGLCGCGKDEGGCR
jgi:hypothetical protein